MTHVLKKQKLATSSEKDPKNTSAVNHETLYPRNSLHGHKVLKHGS